MDDKPSGGPSKWYGRSTKHSWWRNLWPVVANYEDAKLVARTYGAVVSAYLAFSWGAAAVSDIFFDDSPKDFPVQVMLFIFVLLMLLFLWLMRHIWNGKITIVPFILAWFAIQVGATHLTVQGLSGLAVHIIITLFAIGALRGWWAVRKYDRASH